MAEIAAIAQIAGAGLQMAGAFQQGDAAKAAGQYQHVVDVKAGNQALSAAQRDMIGKQQMTDAAKSREVALAAASGGGVQTPTISSIYGETAGRGDYLARADLSKGQQQQWGYDVEGANADWLGQVKQQGAYLSGVGTGLTGLSKVNWGNLAGSMGSAG